MLWPAAKESEEPIAPQEPVAVTPTAIPAEAAEIDTESSTRSDTQGETVAPGSTDEPRDVSGRDERTDEAQPRTKPTPPARLTVLVYPWGSVWVNGKARGSAPLKSESLKPGRYKISAGRDGPSQTRTVSLQQGERKTIRFDLTEP
jgi:hypothetical protein